MDPQPKTALDEEALAEALSEPVGLGFDGPAPSIDELLAAENATGLIELAAAYRAGTPYVDRDLFKALECFEAASRLGHAEAEYFAGLAYFNGLGIGKDPTEGAKRMRSAAQRGSLRAKVYVANLYEMGVVYAVDREKADVWYRNVARAADIDADPVTEAYGLAMAELGSVRHCLALVADEHVPKKDRAFYLKKAKSMGYAHRLQEARRETAPSPPAAPAVGSAEVDTPSEDAAAPAEATASEEKKSAEKTDSAKKTREDDEEEQAPVLLGAQWTWGAGILAFLAAAFFASAATGAGWLAMEGSRALAEAGRALPYVGSMHELVFGAVVLLLGVLPAMATYRPKVVAMASLAGAAAAAGAWYLFDAQPLLWDRLAQAAAGGLGLMLLVLLCLGVLGGTRAR
jgi:hypothetical protein